MIEEVVITIAMKALVRKLIKDVKAGRTTLPLPGDLEQRHSLAVAQAEWVWEKVWEQVKGHLGHEQNGTPQRGI